MRAWSFGTTFRSERVDKRSSRSYAASMVLQSRPQGRQVRPSPIVFTSHGRRPCFMGQRSAREGSCAYLKYVHVGRATALGISGRSRGRTAVDGNVCKRLASNQEHCLCLPRVVSFSPSLGLECLSRDMLQGLGMQRAWTEMDEDQIRNEDAMHGHRDKKELGRGTCVPSRSIDLGKSFDNRGNRDTVQDPCVGTALMLLVHLKCQSFEDDEMMKLDLKTC